MSHCSNDAMQLLLDVPHPDLEVVRRGIADRITRLLDYSVSYKWHIRWNESAIACFRDEYVKCTFTKESFIVDFGFGIRCRLTSYSSWNEFLLGTLVGFN